ncbi:MAG TPA: alpha/beta fold hydrolase [Vicinamibacterales bacterium]|nr:alpha/beta fold hydrolase [Vicinamibacterales bacterium]
MTLRLSTFAAAVVLLAGGLHAQAGVQPVSRTATVFGFKMHYLEAGQGPPVILLHGLGGDGSRWAPNIVPLAADFRVIALDEIGFGESDKPLADYNDGMLSEFLVEFMKTIGLQKASLVGNSMGAAIAAYTAVHDPQYVDKIVLADGAGYKPSGAGPVDPHLHAIQNSTTLAETREFFRIMFYNKSLVTDQMVRANLILRLRSAYTIRKVQESGATGRGGLTDAEMATIKAPTLIMWGKYDGLANPATADRLARDIYGSQKLIVDQCGHMPQLEQSAEFNRIVTAFLKTGRATN